VGKALVNQLLADVAYQERNGLLRKPLRQHLFKSPEQRSSNPSLIDFKSI